MGLSNDSSKYFIIEVFRVKLRQFRIRVARLSRPQLSDLSGVSIATIQRAEEDKPVSELTYSRLIHGLSTSLGRDVEGEVEIQISRDQVDE